MRDDQFRSAALWHCVTQRINLTVCAKFTDASGTGSGRLWRLRASSVQNAVGRSNVRRLLPLHLPPDTSPK